MPRLFAMFAAIILSTVVISSACVANSAIDPVRFTLKTERAALPYRLDFRMDDGGRNNWSSGFRATDLSGLDPARLNGSAAQAIRFSIVREAGRLDCAGTGRSGIARGNCRFAADDGFLALLRKHGIEAPTSREQFGLVALNVRGDLVTALVSSGFPINRVEDLMGLTALRVDRAFVENFARAGYRPRTVNSLMEFAALDISPAYVQSFVRLGYRDLGASDLVQFKALGIDADFVAGFDRLGYGRLPASRLVELKAIGVTPEEAARYRQSDRSLLPVNRLIEAHVLGGRLNVPR